MMSTSKTYLSVQLAHNGFIRLVMAFILVSQLVWIAPALGQDENAETPTEQAEEEEEAIKSRMSLTANQYPDGKIELNGLLRARIEGAYQKVVGESVEFFVIDSAGTETSLGNAKTGANGIATVTVDIALLTPDAEGYVAFLARYEGDEKMTGSESDLRIRRAHLKMTPIETDSSYALALQATAFTPEGELPVPNATVSIFVKRMFSMLKIGEGTTDETGAAEIEVPNTLPGDQDSNIEITAMIEETEEYGNLSATLTKAWGRPVSHEITELPRALWSPNPPLWMMITFFILMTAVWGHFLFIVFLLNRVKSEGKRMRESSR